MNGVLVADKPLGPTSHDVVARVRQTLGLRRIGHTGTLDPLATGVLPLVVGQATRLASLLSASVKEYAADIRFGASTPTYDADARFLRDAVTGAPIEPGPPPPEPPGLTREAIEAALPEFRGTFLQVPPAYSAKKVGGIAAYERARRDQPVAPDPVSVTSYELVLESYAAGLARVRLSCSAGFYVRSLAHDLGQRLGCGAHLEGLRRLRAGEFALSDAVSLAEIERAGPAAASHFIPLDRLLLHLPGVALTAGGARRASHGSALTLADLGDEAAGGAAGDRREQRRVRLLDPSGRLLGIAEPREPGVLHPVIVLV
jgi:tRNA pseudouridine55 synthase